MLLYKDYGDVSYFIMGRTYFLKPIYTTGIYFVDGLLIDTGPANIKDEVRELFSRLKVEQAVNTHHHEDHVGNNDLVLRMFGITPKVERSAIARVKHPGKKLDFYRRLTWGIPLPSEAEEIGDKLTTHKYRFEVIRTPGHADDHICLFERSKGWLFTGDLYLGEKTRILEQGEKIYEIISSLKKLSALPVKVLFCSHKGMLENGKRLLEEKVRYLQKLGETIIELYKAGNSVNQITKKIFPPELLWRLFTNDQFSSRNLVRAFIEQERLN